MSTPRRHRDDAVHAADPRRVDARAISSIPGDALADERRERLADALVRDASARLRATLDATDPAQERYLEWLADEARAALGPAERRALGERALAFAARVVAQAAAERARGVRTPEVRCVDGPAAERAPSPASPTAGRDGVRAAAAERCAPRVALAVAAGAGRELWDEPAEAWVQLPDDVPAGEHVALLVHGDSMVPLLHEGDTILVRLGTDAVPGDVIVVRRPDDGYVVKRVARLTPEALVLASLNTAYADLEVPRDPALVAGTVVLRWCAHAAAGRG